MFALPGVQRIRLFSPLQLTLLDLGSYTRKDQEGIAAAEDAF